MASLAHDLTLSVHSWETEVLNDSIRHVAYFDNQEELVRRAAVARRIEQVG